MDSDQRYYIDTQEGQAKVNALTKKMHELEPGSQSGIQDLESSVVEDEKVRLEWWDCRFSHVVRGALVLFQSCQVAETIHD